MATRVPLGDVRLEQWGWILSLSYQNGNQEQNDIKVLQDNTGCRYTQVYSITDMLNYNERWDCDEWETVHSLNGSSTNMVVFDKEKNLD